MAISVLDRPYGLLRDLTNPISANIYKSSDPIIGASGNIAAIFKTSHGLSDFSRVYIKSNVANYNGFFYVEQITSNVFYIAIDININVAVEFIKNAEITYYICSTQNWDCVHLPIVYKLSNSLWPTNSVDTVRTISSVTDSNGYCALVLSADIKTTGSAAALEFVKVTLATDDDLNGVWQIIAYTNETTFTIAIPYSSANDTALTSASIQYYYNNYHVKVQVWGGLNNGHVYYAQKPYELLATLDLIPDENGICKFSINEILKKHIEIENNLLLGTLPNNLDAFTQFFIKYAEVHDDSDGTTLTQTTPSYTSDLANFEGQAVNAILPFKNIYSGAMSEYLLNTTGVGKFLTNFDTPVIFEDRYFDLSFLWDGVRRVVFLLRYFKDGVWVATVFNDDIDSFYTGVYRAEIESQDCDVYDQVLLTPIQSDQVPVLAPSAWTNISGVFTSKTATTFTLSTIAGGTWQEYMLLSNPPAVNDVLLIQVNFIVSGTWTLTGGGVIRVLYDLVTDSLVDKTTIFVGDEAFPTDVTANGTYSVLLRQNVTGAATRLRIQLIITTITSGTMDVVITVPSTFLIVEGGGNAAGNTTVVGDGIIGETKTIDFNCECLPAQATGFYLSWLNNVGGFDYWLFIAYAEHIIDITDSGETEKNIFPEWPNSYGEFADTIRKQTYRTSRKQALVRSQHLTLDQLDAIKYIKTSPLVQIVNSIYDRRTVIVDTDSFTEYREEDKLYQISLTITYTDDIPSQRL